MERYEAPVIEVIEFKAADIVTISGDTELPEIPLGQDEQIKTENGREHEVSARSFNIVWLSEISIQFQNALKIIGKIVCHLINALLQESGDTVMGGLQIIQHTGELRLCFAAFIQIAHDRV